MKDQYSETKGFQICSFCIIEGRELYKCPKCLQFYCSLRCYRNKKHLLCSEDFYRAQCQQIYEKQNPSGNSKERVGRPAVTFEQYMQNSNINESVIDEDKINPKIPVEADEDILFDSDDEPEYLSKIANSTLEQFSKMDDNELERRLLNAGLPAGMGTSEEQTQEHLEQMFQQLSDEEKKKFTEIADGLFQEEFKEMTNCFRNTKNK